MTTRKRLKSGKQIVMMICLLITVGILCIKGSITVYASDLSGTSNRIALTSTGAGVNIGDTLTVTFDDGNGQVNGALRILLILTLIALAPTLILLMTSFTRIIIVLHFTRSALNTQTAPPNQILIGLALILTFFIMEPTITAVYENAIVPLEEGTISQEEALERGMEPFRTFMYRETLKKDVELFMDIAGREWDSTLEDIPMSILIPSFVVGELRSAFFMGFCIYIPFIVIDMVVASTLMSMGMMMLPPTTISMPFKILLFVLADGWSVIISEVVKTFH